MYFKNYPQKKKKVKKFHVLRCRMFSFDVLKGLSHEIDFKNVDKNLQN
jgi:hypothetical protein